MDQRLKQCTERARKVMQLAEQEAHRFGHPVVEPFHVLLGLVKEGSGVGASALKQFTDLRALRYAVAELFSAGKEQISRTFLPWTHEIELFLEDALEAAHEFHHTYVGTEHLLLALLKRVNNAIKVLEHCAIQPDEVRQTVLWLLGVGQPPIITHAVSAEESLEFVVPPCAPCYSSLHFVACATDVRESTIDRNDNKGFAFVGQLFVHQVFLEMIVSRAVFHAAMLPRALNGS